MIISTGRAASTAIYRYLDQQGDVGLPVNKEPHYWCDIQRFQGLYPLLEDLHVADRGEYESLYADASHMIDASVGYFFTIDEVIKKLESVGQRPKVLLLYREPVSRSASLFNELRKKGLERHDDLQVALGAARPSGLWWEHYYDNVAYAEVFRSIVGYFPELLAVNYEAFSADPAKMMLEIMDFIGVPSVNEISYPPINSSAEAILMQRTSGVSTLKRLLPSALKRAAVKLLFAVRGLTASSDLAIAEHLPFSTTQYGEFRALVDHEDIYRKPRRGSMIDRVIHDGLELALIIRRSFRTDGIEFLTPGDYSQQVGYMNRPKAWVIPPHIHNPVHREVRYTQEVLLIRSGRVRVDFYSDEREYIESAVLEAGDVILLAHGGHGFEMLERSEIIEVKQGPYAGDEDKTRFESVGAEKIRIRGEET